MISFKQYIVEYVKNKQTADFFGISKIKSGSNGKVFDRINNRKHANTVKKDYEHKSPIISSIVNGKANNIQMAGAPLLSILMLYNTEYEDNTTKTLGNSGVEVQMLGGNRGVLRKKEKGHSNGLQ